MRIVEFENGKFAIRYRSFLDVIFKSEDYLDIKHDYFWTHRECVASYCLFDTLEEAKTRLNSYNKEIRNKFELRVKKVY